MVIDEIIAGYAAIVATAAIMVPVRQAKKAHKPQIELALIHTKYSQDDDPLHMVTLEARNRGDYPIRIVGAGISSPKVHYQFLPDTIRISTTSDRRCVSVDTGDQAVLDKLKVLPLPGIILPQDGASRFVADNLAAIVLAIALIEEEKEDQTSRVSEPRFAANVAESFNDALHGWVEVSTGEYIETKPMKFDWDALKVITK